MNTKEAREIERHYFKGCGSGCGQCTSTAQYDEAKGYLAALEGPEVTQLVASLEKFKQVFEAFGKRQRELLVEGQNLESASKNWDSFPEAFNFDLAPIFEALAAFKQATGKEREG